VNTQLQFGNYIDYAIIAWLLSRLAQQNRAHEEFGSLTPRLQSIQTDIEVEGKRPRPTRSDRPKCGLTETSATSGTRNDEETVVNNRGRRKRRGCRGTSSWFCWVLLDGRFGFSALNEPLGHILSTSSLTKSWRTFCILSIPPSPVDSPPSSTSPVPRDL
ncbi:unnamed protein product, partial [Rhizoctonia solani]